MARSGKRKPIIDGSEEEEQGKVIVLTSSDDEDANADLVLKVAERATRSRCENKRVAVSENGDSVISFEAGESLMSINRKKKLKKLKKQKTEIGEAPVLIEEKTDAFTKKVENVTGAEVSELSDGAIAIDTESPNTVLRMLLRGPRYFDPPESGWNTCFNCGEGGHIAVHCTSEKRKKKPCFVCGSFDHQARDCTAGIECFICKQPGHRAKDCHERYNFLQNDLKLCLKCGDSGHDMFLCRNDYPSEDLKLIQCYVCKKFGHLCCVNIEGDNRGLISCYRCGKSGHLGSVCEMRHDGNSIFTSKTFHLPSSPCLQDRKSQRKLESKSASHVIEKTRRKKKSKIDKGVDSTPKQSKKRGGWIVEDPGEIDSVKLRKRKRKSVSTPSKWSDSNHLYSKSNPGFIQEYSYGTPCRSQEKRYQTGRRNYSNSREGYYGSYGDHVNDPGISNETPVSNRYECSERKHGHSGMHSHSSRKSNWSGNSYTYHEHSNGIDTRSGDHSRHSTPHSNSKGFHSRHRFWPQ